MKIEHIVVVVVMLVLAACGASKKVVHEEATTSVKTERMTDITGIEVVHGDARMSEGLSVSEVEVYYSLPDSSGEQHVERMVKRTIETKRDAEVEVISKDSVLTSIQETLAEEVMVEHKEERVKIPMNMIALYFVVLIILIVFIKCVS